MPTEAATLHKCTVRALTKQDLDPVVDIDTSLEGRVRRAYFERRLASALRHPEHHVQLGAHDDRGLAGYVMARRVRGEFGRPLPGLRIEVVGVAADRRGLGVGRKLIDALVNYARSHGIAEFRTTSLWRNHRMLAWLDAMGFELTTTQIVDCAVADGYQAERGDVLDLPEGTVDRPENDFSELEDNDFERVATVLPEVRPMQAADLAPIVRIDREINGVDRHDYIKAKLDEAMEDTAIRVSLAARLDGAIVGYVMARADLGDFGRTEPVAVLDTLGVDPAYAHRGVGHALISQLFANLGALQVDRVETVVETTQLDLLGFLYHTGFKPSSRLSFVRTV